MALLIVVPRAAGQKHVLGLGWLLALAIGGAVLLFTAIGLLLSWKVKARNNQAKHIGIAFSPSSDSSSDHHQPGSAKRLSKRKVVISESTTRFSLTLPPILPSLPSYNSIGFFNGPASRNRSRSWVEEDKFHGPKVNKVNRESWFSRDSWLGRVPTLPRMSLDDEEKGQVQVDIEIEQTVLVQKRQSITEVKPDQTIPPALKPEDSTRGRIRVPAQAYMRPSVTDSELRDILWNTELRLREGKSQSPTKTTPRSSPQKGSPVKTPHSYKSVASSVRTDGTVRITRLNSSPSKRATLHIQLPYTSSRKASISSIGSATNSLIAEATLELEQLGGLSSPNKATNPSNPQWGQMENKQPGEKRPRSKSLDSDNSSSLSTLYSVNDPEDKKPEEDDDDESSEQDPFIEKSVSGSSSSESKPLFGPRSMRRRTMTTSTTNLQRKTEQQPKPSHFRHPSVSTQAVGGPSLSIVLRPPSEQLYPQNPQPQGERIALAFPVSLSETSMVTPSVTTVTDDDDASLLSRNGTIRETPKLDWLPPRHRASLILSPASPSTVPSSPYDERDMMTLLLSSDGPTRAPDDLELPTPLSPPPQRPMSQQTRQTSQESAMSSDYNADLPSDDPGAVSTGSPSRRHTHRSLRDPPPQGSVGSTVVELRRMNSMVSSYSVASMTSSAQGDTESPTLPLLRGGGFPTTSRMSRHNYLNLGTSPTKNRMSRGGATTRSSRLGLGIDIREDELEEGNETSESELKMPLIDLPQGLREGRRSSCNQRRDSILGGKPRHSAVGGLVAEAKKESKRQSAESMGLYDTEGFLVSSPDAEAKGRRLRM